MIFHGLLPIDKPGGMTSHDVVARARRLLNQKAVGHTGTLDPLASGLMVLVLGEATKLSNYILDGDKGYEVGFKLGVETDSYDITGQVLSEKPVTVSPQEVQQKALSLKGEFNWTVPVYSAKKVDGEKLYEKARRGEEVEAPHKLMRFWDIQTTQEGRYSLICSKGSYVRSWVSELGKLLGCGATMTSLRRFYSQPFQLQQAQTLEQLEEDMKLGQGPRAFIDVSRALVGVKRILVSGQDQVLLKNGQISHQLRRHLVTSFDPEKDQIIQVLSRDSQKLMAIVGLDPARGFCVKRAFNL